MTTTLLAAEMMTRTTTAEAVAFWILAVIAVAGAIGVVAAPKAVYSAIFLATTMIALAMVYVAQDALFLGVVQVVVYTGAVMMLFLFVLMLVGVDSSESLVETIRGQRVAAMVAGLGFGILLIAGIGNIATTGFVGLAEANAGGNVQGLATLIFTRDLWAFELTSALLITAALGGDGAGAPGALRAAKDPAGVGGRALPNRGGTGDSTSQPRRVRPPQRRQHARPTPRRHRGGILGQHDPSYQWERRRPAMNPDNYLYLSALLFTIGAAGGVLLRRNAIVMFMCVELMLNAANLAFVTFSRMHGHLDGQVVAFFTMVVAACEVVVGLAIIMTIFRTRRSANVDDAHLLRH